MGTDYRAHFHFNNYREILIYPIRHVRGETISNRYSKITFLLGGNPMNSKSKWLIAIMVVLLLVTSVISAGSGLSFYKVDWGNPHQRGTSTWITIYVNNDNYHSVSSTAVLQLKVPLWYTRVFLQNFTVFGYAKEQPVQINFTIDRSWPTGDYNALVSIPSLGIDGLNGVITVK